MAMQSVANPADSITHSHETRTNTHAHSHNEYLNLCHNLSQYPSPRTFTLFPALPFEIRLKIYRAFNNSPRSVLISYKSVFTPRERERGKRTLGTHLNWDGSRWISKTRAPALLHTSREARAETLKAYSLAFESREAPASIYFNFDVDTLYFGSGEGDGIYSPPAPYRLDMFLSGDYYGCRDAEKVRYLAVDIPEELYGRRAFCWEEIRGFAGLKGVVIVIRENEFGGNDEEENRSEGSSGAGGTLPRKVSLMAFYERSLRRVWDAYVKGEGESEIEGEWNVPEIRVWNVLGASSWGNVKLNIKDKAKP